MDYVEKNGSFSSNPEFFLDLKKKWQPQRFAVMRSDIDTGNSPDGDSFSTNQKRIIESRARRIQVIAAAGSGKTRTVTGIVKRDLETTGIPPLFPILILSFSRKSVREIRERLPFARKESILVSTFHSLCFRLIREFHPDFGFNGVRILDDDLRKEILQGYFRSRKEQTGGIPFSILLNQRRRVRDLFPELYREMDIWLTNWKQRNGYLEYEDLIRILLNGMKKGEEWCLSPLKRYRKVIVDEFQDTDPQQLEFLRLLDPPSLIVVGDDWQAIYGFRGATVEPFLKFPEIFSRTRVYRLSENYRSYRDILKTGEKIIACSPNRLKKKVRAIRGNPEESVVFRMNFEEEDRLPLIHWIHQQSYRFQAGIRILTRTNERIDRWLSCGLPEDLVMTIHRAKGLEFPFVFLDLTAGWGTDRNDPLPEEELRIAYVGVTRAMNRLILLETPLEDSGFEGTLKKRLQVRFIQRATMKDLSRICRLTPEEQDGS